MATSGGGGSGVEDSPTFGRRFADGDPVAGSQVNIVQKPGRSYNNQKQVRMICKDYEKKTGLNILRVLDDTELS